MNLLKKCSRFLLFSSAVMLALYSCTTIDLYEKAANIPDHAWKSSFQPSFEFTIKDTSAPYQVFLVLRHTDKYRFNNIYVNLHIQGPGQDSAIKIQRDITLGSNAKGWLGKGMDDIYEQRRELGDPLALKAGTYKFTLEQVMREDPLLEVINAGIRVEKK